MGNDLLLVFPIYYGDGFAPQRSGFQVTSLGITGFARFSITLFYIGCKEKKER